MKEISHEQAQAYLHTSADESLGADEKALLDAHLPGCDACRAYAKEIIRLEGALRTSMQHRWNYTPVTLPLDRILGRQHTSPLQRAFSIAATPILVVALMLMAIIMTRGTLNSGNGEGSTATKIIAATVPTPSVQLIHTITAVTDCPYVMYTVQEGDTLDSISAHYLVSKEALMKHNELKNEQLTPSDSLFIPLCERQTLTPTTTLTYTPSLPSSSFTP